MLAVDDFGFYRGNFLLRELGLELVLDFVGVGECAHVPRRSGRPYYVPDEQSDGGDEDEDWRRTSRHDGV